MVQVALGSARNERVSRTGGENDSARRKNPLRGLPIPRTRRRMQVDLAGCVQGRDDRKSERIPVGPGRLVEFDPAQEPAAPPRPRRHEDQAVAGAGSVAGAVAARAFAAAASASSPSTSQNP